MTTPPILAEVGDAPITQVLGSISGVGHLAVRWSPRWRPSPSNGIPAFDQIVGNPRGLPHLPPQGAWGEIINVTSRWIVIQNHYGSAVPDRRQRHRRIPGPMAQQRGCPDESLRSSRPSGRISATMSSRPITLTSSRGPIKPSSPQPIIASSQQRHGDDHRPRLQAADEPLGLSAGRTCSTAGPIPWVRADRGIPTRMHVVGNAVNRSPLQLGIPGNNIATVVGPPVGRVYASPR